MLLGFERFSERSLRTCCLRVRSHRPIWIVGSTSPWTCLSPGTNCHPSLHQLPHCLGHGAGRAVPARAVAAGRHLSPAWVLKAAKRFSMSRVSFGRTVGVFTSVCLAHAGPHPEMSPHPSRPGAEPWGLSSESTSLVPWARVKLPHVRCAGYPVSSSLQPLSVPCLHRLKC